MRDNFPLRDQLLRQRKKPLGQLVILRYDRPLLAVVDVGFADSRVAQEENGFDVGAWGVDAHEIDVEEVCTRGAQRVGADLCCCGRGDGVEDFDEGVFCQRVDLLRAGGVALWERVGC